jgi:hypothetical protein
MVTNVVSGEIYRNKKTQKILLLFGKRKSYGNTRGNGDL